MIGFTVRHLITSVSPATFEKHLLAGFVEFLNLKMFGFNFWSANGPTWYISAMLIIMLLIYPLLRKRFDLFCYVIAPLTGFFLLGFFELTGTDLRTPMEAVSNTVLKGTLRGLMEICFGIMLYPLITALSKIRFRIGVRCIFSLIELLCYLFYFRCLQGSFDAGKTDTYCVIVLLTAVLLSFSQTGVFSELFNNRLFTWLGKFSLSIYLGHRCWSLYIAAKMKNAGYTVQLLWFIILSSITALFIHLLSQYLRKNKQRIFNTLSGWCIRDT